MIKFVGVAQEDNASLLYYLKSDGGNNSFNIMQSSDGFQFGDQTKPVIVVDNKQKAENKFDWKSFRISNQNYQYVLTYKHTSPGLHSLHVALSIDLVHWQKVGKIDIKETGALVPGVKHDGKYIMYYGEKNIKVAYSSDLRAWNMDSNIILESRPGMFDDGDIEVGNAYDIDGYIMLVYYAKRKDEASKSNNSNRNIFQKILSYGRKVDDNEKYHAGAVLIEKSDPTKVVWRSDNPIWQNEHDFIHKKMVPLGSAVLNDELVLYWLVDDVNLFTVSCPIPHRTRNLVNRDFTTIFKKSDNNPIIAPNPAHPWESRATFNSAAIYEDGKVHFIYRALGDSDLSVLGYATSTDGINIDERSEEPIYIPREPFETPGNQAFKTFADHFASGGGYGGVEDPRITKIDDTFYMTYVAFDGANPPRVALTSISTDDFLNKRWESWSKPKLISSPGMVNKNAVIFPEKVNGKYVVFHRIYPNILVDYVDDLGFEDKYLQGHYFIPPRKNYWDSKKIGAGAPPIKTDDGWLFIYQSVGHRDPHKYKIGAMLLDINDPKKVISRTSSPIIEPVEKYENEGFKAGVAYPCGAVAFNNKLHVYYGGADTVVCAASTDLDRFLYEMKHDREPVLRRAQGTLFSN